MRRGRDGHVHGQLLALAAIVRPGDEVLAEHPTYEPLIAAARYLGAEVRHFARRAEDGFRLDPAEVERRITPRTRAVVLTNLHNPSSALADDDALRQIGALAERVGARVIVDEVYLDALWEPAPRTAFHLGERFICTNSLTKVYGLNGLRCGWILADAEITERAWRLTELFNNIGVHAAERLSVIAFQNLDAIARRSARAAGRERRRAERLLRRASGFLRRAAARARHRLLPPPAQRRRGRALRPAGGAL